MRHAPTWVATFFLLASGPLAADDSRFALFAGIQPGASSDESGVDVDVGWSFGIELPVHGDWSGELMLSLEELGAIHSESQDTSLELGDRQLADASVRYRFGEAGRWSFHGGLGLRYGYRDGFAGGPSQELWSTVGSFSADWVFSRRFSLRLDARHSLVDLSGDSDGFELRTFTTGFAARF